MNPLKGTPSTLRNSIKNGIDELFDGSPPEFPLAALTKVEDHVRDYLSQKFSVAMINSKDAETVSELWFAITGMRIKK